MKSARLSLIELEAKRARRIREQAAEITDTDCGLCDFWLADSVISATACVFRMLVG